MPHTVAGGLGEPALLMFAADLRWRDIGVAAGVPMSGLKDAEGRTVYSSVYYVELGDFPDEGLGAFRPDDDLDVVSDLMRYGRAMLDGYHRFHRAGELPGELPDDLPAELPRAPYVRLSNVCVCEGAGPEDLRISAPATGRIENVPEIAQEPDSYGIIRTARRAGRFWGAPADAERLWAGTRTIEHAINPDRDLNGVGLVYFANYVAFMDLAERKTLQDAGVYTPTALDARVTVRRRIGCYGNAQRHDSVAVDVEAWRLADGRRLLLHHRVRRAADDRLIAVSSVEKLLRA
jgi:probable biosynthetic protein (TIGR04098 family)